MGRSKHHPIQRGDQGGRFQRGRGYDRYLLEGKIVTGEDGGKFQKYGRGGKNRRYLLK